MTRPEPSSPPTTGIAAIDHLLPTLRLLAPQGFVFIHNLGMTGPELVHSEFPVEWRREYERRNYMWADPVLLWSMLSRGDKRWSEIGTMDVRDVLTAARRFDLNFGAIFCRGLVKKSVLSLSRADREFTLEEMTLLSGLMDKLVSDMSGEASLSLAEIDTLRLFRDGLSYKEIAQALGLSPSTVKLRLSTARHKLRAASNVHALALAIQRNLL